mgnify:CR=1 FL=1
MTVYTPLAIANAVLNEAWLQGKSVTIMQLLKLVYIAHGWSLALLNAPLVNEEAEAWQHGPIFPSIYRGFRRFGSNPIVELASTPFGPLAEATLTAEQRNLISSVVKNYGDMHAFRLSRITHEVDTPWSKTYDGGRGSSDDIPNALVAEHYRKLARERSATA